MKRGARFSLSLLLVCAALSQFGCSSPHDASVSGSVTFAGKPLDTGTVVFHPVAPGPTAYGSIGVDGRYALRTGTTPGLKPGEYRVTVGAAGKAPPATPENSEPVGESLIPLRYGAVDSSGLTFQVRPGANDFSLELTK